MASSAITDLYPEKLSISSTSNIQEKRECFWAEPSWLKPKTPVMTLKDWLTYLRVIGESLAMGNFWQDLAQSEVDN